jgi:hypothetical protein
MQSWFSDRLRSRGAQEQTIRFALGMVCNHCIRHRPWLAKLLDRRPTKVAAIALTNKIARMALSMMAENESNPETVALARRNDTRTRRQRRNVTVGKG